jgi:hypothetical protein
MAFAIPLSPGSSREDRTLGLAPKKGGKPPGSPPFKTIVGKEVPRAGLEPAASRSSVLHSPKLSYRGAGGCEPFPV